MLRLVIQVLLSALVFTHVLPMIDGIQVHGTLIQSVIMGAFFGLMLWVVSSLAKTASAIFAFGTFGLGLFVLIPMWLIGFWVLPAIALKLVADTMPAHLHVAGWIPAFWGGLVLLFVQLFTGGFSMKITYKQSEKDQQENK